MRHISCNFNLKSLRTSAAPRCRSVHLPGSVLSTGSLTLSSEDGDGFVAESLEWKAGCWPAVDSAQQEQRVEAAQEAGAGDGQPPDQQEEQPAAKPDGDSAPAHPETSAAASEKESEGEEKDGEKIEQEGGAEEQGAPGEGEGDGEDGKGVKRKREEEQKEEEAGQSTEKKKVCLFTFTVKTEHWAYLFYFLHNTFWPIDISCPFKWKYSRNIKNKERNI